MAFLGVYRAVYDYAPQGEGELEITEGDLLFVLEKSTDDDWWRAKKKAMSDEEDEPEGLIPNNYVEEAQPTHKAKALYDYTNQTDEEISFAEDAQLDVYDTTDPDWTLVGYGGKFGFAPAIYIEISDSAAPPAPAAIPAAPPMPTRNQTQLAPPPPLAEPEEDDDSPLPSPVQNPAKALAGIIAQRTGGGAPAPAEISREPASPPLPSRPTQQPIQFTPEESEEEAPPPMPTRPRSEVRFAPPEEERHAPRPIDPRPIRREEAAGVIASPPYNRAMADHYDESQPMQSPGGFKLFHVSEMVSSMGKNKKMPTTLGINLARGLISISPAKARDGPQQEWTADKLTHYSIEGKHVFLELVRPSKSVDFHAGAKDTASEITSMLGELAGASRAEGLREVLAAASGSSGSSGQKKGHMVYEFMAQGDDEVTVALGDEIIILDDTKSDEWWMVRRLKNGKEGVVPSSYVEITGTIPAALEPTSSFSGVNAGRSTVEQNRLEEERMAREAAKKHREHDRESKFMDDGVGASLPARQSSLAPSDADKRHKKKRDEAPKSRPNPSRMRTWTDRSGSFRVDAEFLGLKDNKIHLHKDNGVKIAVPVAKMAVEDLEYVEKMTGVSLDEDKPLSDIKRRNTQRDRERQAKRDTNGITTTKEPTYDWFDFFLAAGVNPQICERYAQNFARDQMGEEILPEVTPPLLRTLGLKEGDILRVMKHLDAKFGRTNGTPTDGDANGGGLFSGPGGALRNNTRKGRPTPATQASDVVDADALRQKSADEDDKKTATPADTADTLSSPVPPPAPPKDNVRSGFDDDAWSVKPSKSPQPQPAQALAAPKAPSPAPTPVSAAPPPQAPKLTGSMNELSLLSPALEPTPVATPQPSNQQQPTAGITPTQPPASKPTADAAFFDKLGAPATQNILAQPTGRARPMAPPLNTGTSAIAPPPRAASAPGFPNPQMSAFSLPTPLSAQMTGYQQPMATGYQAPPGQSLQSLQQQQQQQQQQMMNGSMQYQQNGMMSQPTGFQGMMQPQMTGFYPQQQQGMYQQPQQLQMQPTASPFADPPRPPFQPSPSAFASPNSMLPPAMTPLRTGFTNPNLQPQPTGFGGVQQQYPNQQPPGLLPGQQLPPGMTLNGNGALVPQQTGFGQAPSPQPLMPQKTGPAPPVRFGTTGLKPLAPTPTGRRANLSNATPQNPFGF
ncbi:hypothetical protein K461DRAFT_277717 [Myriangium duriaei CBS 260.36]|uniref:Actin cytoskeleton-regulatory complex protein SLA1 n=1 Tax=Myriangium duriaei CBS 260.36 TaxID=1168546 RepID=A0A9P4J5U1_9PEZI|nr:hypothetical protein K461DRAFT_277717 [Myriangium duriaei CBS 260.36]